MLTETRPDLCCDVSASACWKRETCAAVSPQLRRCDEVLRRAGLRPTLQRRQLSQLLFGNGDCHVTAEALYEAAIAAGMKLSQATVYNTLNQFTQLGLLRQIGIDGSRSFFDTNTTVHPHFFFEDEGRLIDVSETVAFDQLPEPLPGFGMERVDVVIHLRRKPSAMSAHVANPTIRHSENNTTKSGS